MSVKNTGAQNDGEVALQNLFADVFQQLSKHNIRPEVSVSFYPFAGLNHTIRLRNQRIYVRMSDILRQAPSSIYFALAQILVGKLLKRRPQSKYEAHYRQYVHQPHVLRASELARQQRGRKQIGSAKGQTYDLVSIFARLNRYYFDDALPQPRLSWSRQRTKRILGHHDAVHETIIISRSLDNEAVPDFVVEYVMYHEMLHIKHRPHIHNGRRRYHTSAFRTEEKRFVRYHAALQWLEQLTSHRFAN